MTIHIRDTKNFNSEKFLTDLEEAIRNISCEEGSVDNHFNTRITVASFSTLTLF